MVADMQKLGIKVVPHLNSWPRFLEKIKRGDVQLFRIAWIGDYPDGQNFLQLFYSPNAGSCNRAFYRNTRFDQLYEKALNLPDCPRRTALYRAMQNLLVQDCPWIFESYPVGFRLTQPWLKHYVPHHFAYDHWKYLEVDRHTENSKRSGRQDAQSRHRTIDKAIKPVARKAKAPDS